MTKKQILVCMAAAILSALAAPAAAMALNRPVLTEASTPVEAGKLIEAKNTELPKMTTSLGTLECSTAILTGRVHRNVTGNVEAEVTTGREGGTGTTVAGAEEPECTSLFGNYTVRLNPATNGLPWCIVSNETMAEDEFQVIGGACTSTARGIRFAWDVTGIGTCQYQRSGASPVRGTFTTNDDSILSISEQEFSGIGLSNPFGCPGSGKLDMKFTMTTDGTTTAVGVTP